MEIDNPRPCAGSVVEKDEVTEVCGILAINCSFPALQEVPLQQRLFTHDNNEDQFLIGVRDGAIEIEIGCKRGFPQSSWLDKQGQQVG